MAHVVPCSPARLTLLLPANKMMTEAGSLLFANFANKFANMCFNLQTINIFYKYKVVFCLFRKIIYNIIILYYPLFYTRHPILFFRKVSVVRHGLFLKIFRTRPQRYENYRETFSSANPYKSNMPMSSVTLLPDVRVYPRLNDGRRVLRSSKNEKMN